MYAFLELEQGYSFIKHTLYLKLYESHQKDCILFKAPRAKYF
jgi:hypothetical protein